MLFSEFEQIVSPLRINRYKATMQDETKALCLYEKNVALSLNIFAIINYFEIALRNSIDKHLTSKHQSTDWLCKLGQPNGYFDNAKCQKTYKIVSEALGKLRAYSPSNLLTKMDFSFWRYLFEDEQYKALGNSLLSIFPKRPKSTKLKNYGHKYIFNQLGYIHVLRNRIAHHEPICFKTQSNIKSTQSIQKTIDSINTFFSWLDIPKDYYIDLDLRIRSLITDINNI